METCRHGGQVLQLQEATGQVTVVEGVTVDLVELDSPAPAGDDFVAPPDGSSELQEPDGTTVRATWSYLGPTDDHQVATAVTERHGLALVTTVLDDVGGALDVVRTRYGPGGPGFTTRSVEGAHGDNPDLALTVTLKDGFLPVRRRPIALNLGEHRLGTVQEPVRIVYVDRCVGERHAVSDAAAAVAEIEHRLAELKAEYESLPPSEQGPVGKMIRKIQNGELAPATAKLAAAREALQACQQTV
jgi:hypothetical protein